MKRVAGGMQRRWVGFLALAFLLSGCVSLQAEAITIVSWNVQNYVVANRMVDGVYRENYPKPESEKRALRAVIKALNADVIALQEMGPLAYLEELKHDLAGEGVDYPYAELLEAADPERHVAVLSRRKFSAVTRHTDIKFKYFGAEELVKRGLLELRLESDAGAFTLFVVHLKSRLTDRKDDPESAVRRTGEAQAVRSRILSRFPQPDSARFLIVGDFNDNPASKTLGLLTSRGKTDVAEILPAMDSRGETWTHFYKKEDIYSRVDHVLVSPAFKSTVVDGKVRICDLSEVALASDHRPVVVKLNLEKKAE